MKKSNNESEAVKSTLSVGEVAARAGVAVSALHFYEEKGLIASERNSGNQRRYPRGVLRVISLIKVAQRLGFSLEKIKDTFAELPTDHQPSNADWNRLAKKWQTHLDEQIELLTKLKTQLNSCIGCGCLSMKDCPLRNPDDKLAKKGPGPQLL
ncbi:redox-sensitive transcriptional activator SoxR [Bdellovibrio sp. HCB2-146]|uniref:redox-sensitive transcriptional activator SoxR n=1 Tax=Bdellovibrio sp. HCB2-146 TaxID=3394362 RepID=UPI0039BCFBC3